MAGGHILIPRAIEDWEWFDDKTMFYVWIRIILMANWEEKRWHGETVEKGSFITSIGSLSNTLGISVRQARTCIGRLIDDKLIVIETTNKRTKITICNYESYQGYATNKRQANDKQDVKKTTTTKVYDTSDTIVSSYPIQESLFKDEERDTSVSPKKSEIDYGYVLKLWNISMKRKIPKLKAVSDARKDKIQLRVAEMGGWEEAKETIAECFRKMNDSDYCNGENENVWVATFDWFFSNEKNWLKVIEGNYDNRQRKSQLEIFAENVAKANAYYEQRYHGYGGASPYGDQAGSGPYGPDEQ